MKKLNELTLQMISKLMVPVQNERGSQTLEWLGIAAVVVLVVGLVSTAFGEGDSIGTSIREAFDGWIDQIGG
ncbi:hypothetical protein KP77_01590 [Jeotgalibacillus alimentarius]|uniref:Uncharacterized protein n=1 Tax=Jeotgalibacillus alimentarius TaxID=135826 RepID=A0A0C2SIA4_9BACL|nr:hypothetical protein [Jeotgalibacillus alimentarius]KIL53664.1 hypothetical protein KP77_01590 [Jeotgalibacillus alimentarius]